MTQLPQSDDPEFYTGTWCPECGPNVRICEEGMCASCGNVAVGAGTETALKIRDELVALKAELEEDLKNTVFTEYTEVPVCPHCEHLDDDWHDLSFLRKDGDSTETDCVGCGKPMKVTMHIEVSFSTEKPKCYDQE